MRKMKVMIHENTFTMSHCFLISMPDIRLFDQNEISMGRMNAMYLKEYIEVQCELRCQVSVCNFSFLSVYTYFATLNVIIMTLRRTRRRGTRPGPSIDGTTQRFAQETEGREEAGRVGRGGVAWCTVAVRDKLIR